MVRIFRKRYKTQHNKAIEMCKSSFLYKLEQKSHSPFLYLFNTSYSYHNSLVPNSTNNSLQC